MTTPARQWVAAHGEQPPVALRGRLDALLTTRESAGDAPVSAALLSAGEELLAKILGSGSTQRDAALDLLTADALVTYAFEAAAADPATLDAQASVAMRTISALVDARTR